MEGKPEAELKSHTEDKKLDDTSEAGGSRGLDRSSQGDGSKKSGRNIGGERFQDRTRTSR